MKEGLIKITGMDDVFYDSIERLYRYRMFCPSCGKYSGCRCFPELEDAEFAYEEENDCTCSYKCSLIAIADFDGWDDVLLTMKSLGLMWRLRAIVVAIGLYFDEYWISEETCKKYFNEVDYDFDYIEGEFC